MGEFLKIILTASMTITCGIVVYVVGRMIEKLVIDPLVDYRKLKGAIGSLILFYSDKLLNINVSTPEEKRVISNEIRKLATELAAKTDSILIYNVLHKFKFLPDKDALRRTTKNLFLLSNLSLNESISDIIIVVDKINDDLDL